MFISEDVISEHALKAVDFKGEAMTFKATAGAVLTTLEHCLEAVGQREEVWRRRLERETERRRKLEEIYRVMKQQPSSRVIVHGGPDHEVSSTLLFLFKDTVISLLSFTFCAIIFFGVFFFNV